MKYKHWSDDTCWLPESNSESLQLLKENIDVASLLQDLPSKVLPAKERKNDMDGIKSNISKLKDFLDHRQYAWWEEFLKNEEGDCGEDWFSNFLSILLRG